MTVPPKDATMFTVHIRAPKLVQDAALAVSGVAGLYFEPRTHDGTKPSEQRCVIWLPRTTLPEVRRHAQAIKTAVSVARHGAKLGVRVEAAQAEKIHNE